LSGFTELLIPRHSISLFIIFGSQMQLCCSLTQSYLYQS